MESRRVLPSVAIGLVMAVFATSVWWLFRPQPGGPDRRPKAPLLDAFRGPAVSAPAGGGPFVRDETTVSVESGVRVFAHSNTGGPGASPTAALASASDPGTMTGPPDDGACASVAEGLGAAPAGDAEAP